MEGNSCLDLSGEAGGSVGSDRPLDGSDCDLRPRAVRALLSCAKPFAAAQRYLFMPVFLSSPPGFALPFHEGLPALTFLQRPPHETKRRGRILDYVRESPLGCENTVNSTYSSRTTGGSSISAHRGLLGEDARLRFFMTWISRQAPLGAGAPRHREPLPSPSGRMPSDRVEDNGLEKRVQDLETRG
ncbi:hypothetical protein NL676_003103 [Syzygium grande]|nr:hypothetical protein NL676_003103 [Syzygium grande]